MRNHTLLLLLLLLFLTSVFCTSPTTVNVGLILDLNSPVGLMSQTAITLAVSDFYASHPNSTTRLRLRTRHSGRDDIAAASAAVDLLVNEQVQAIIGPQTSAEAAFVADLGTKAHVPVVSFSATSPSLTPNRAPYFVRTAPGDAAQAQPIAALVQAFGWRRVVPIYEDSDYGTALLPYLIDALDAVNVQVPYRTVLPTSASDDRIRAELYKLMTQQTRVFVVHATSKLGPRLFAGAASVGMMGEGYVWIVTAGLASVLGSLDPSHVLESMQGVLGVKPHIPRSREFQEFKKRWRREFIKENPTSADVPELSTFGVWAYDTVWAVATAVDAVGQAGAGFDRPKLTNNSTEMMSAIGVSRTGQKLLGSMVKTQFEGLGGKFRLVDGERNVTAFQIVNVIGERERAIGFWTARYGLTKHLNLSSESSYSASREGVGSVIWPGDSTVVPKGWEAPTSGRKLRIAVPGPVEAGFQSFLKVEKNPVTNETVASGFVIEVFEAAVAQLPYALPFEYVAFQNGDGKSSGDYNNLVQQVFLQKFDAVVGDVTITANRSLYVDFTMPYTGSGVSMVVPVIDDRSKNAWIFLKPLTTDLWLVSGAFFVFTGMAVWVLEHRINEEFRGPPAHQLGTVFYFSFSTLVFAHREAIVSNLARFVVVIWVFVVLILQSSYIASLTSMLTVQQIQPTVTDISELKKNHEYVGYLEDSFVHGLLLKLGFEKSRLKPYKSPQQYKDALSRGSSNGGVAAIIDEIPYLKVFLKDYCDNYIMTGEIIKTNGFGFVFPKGSPIVPDLSMAILNITEGDQMVEIERKWFGDQSTCPDKGSTLSSNSLDFQSFWGLFLITGIASLLSLLIYFASFLYKNKDVFKDIASKESLRHMILYIARVFDQKDLSSHTFKRDELKDRSMIVTGDLTTSPDPNGSESPFSISNHTYGGTPSIEPTSPKFGDDVEMSTTIGEQ